ncbi:MAG TPA: aldehyde dehydrogenase family protein, partial [Candidatus Elarobacter sp.]|nr:aldehyde dehydrogenase family protein [Candidatus Elarobacter sp.]
GPTIFAPRDEMQAIAREEVFGPVLSVFRFDSLDEVVARANATRYGLSSYIWTASIANGMRFAERVRAGMCWINGYFLRDLRQPFGGVGMSGLGREGGRWSLDFFTEPKLVCISY